MYTIFLCLHINGKIRILIVEKLIEYSIYVYVRFKFKVTKSSLNAHMVSFTKCNLTDFKSRYDYCNIIVLFKTIGQKNSSAQ